jgi:DNA repair ATPase RecN
MIVAPLPAGHEETFMDLKLIVAMLAIAAVPVCSQAQQSSTAKLNADAQNVIKIITGDKAKTQTYCQIADLIDQREETAEQEKVDELSQKITVLVASLPEYAALVRDLQDTDIDPKSQDAHEIGSTLTALDKLCED